MDSIHHQTDDPPAGPATGHETTDVDARSIVLSAIALAVGLVAVQGIAVATLTRLTSRAEISDQGVSPLAGPEVPGGPRLQAAPSRELAELQAAQHRLLDRYEWVDRRQKIVRIPIERAIDLVVEHGPPDFKHERGSDDSLEGAQGNEKRPRGVSP